MLNLHVESWIWAGVVSVVVLLRYISRWCILRSIKKLELEDYVMLFVFGVYLTLVNFLNIVMEKKTNLVPKEEVSLLTPESIKERRFGSKIILVVEQCMCVVIWGCKVCFLLIFWKLAWGLRVRLLIKLVASYVVATFLVMEILYFGFWCRPFNQYWDVPPNNLQCSTATRHLILNMVFNVTSDAFIMSVPLPMLLKLQIPWPKKVALNTLFSLGIFVIVCACLSKAESFKDPFSPVWEWWYIRESSVALCVVNIPHCWALLRRMFRLRSFFTGATGATGANGLNGGNTDVNQCRRGTTGTQQLPLSHHPAPLSNVPSSRQCSRSGESNENRDAERPESSQQGEGRRHLDMPRNRLELELRQLEEV